MKLKCWVGPLLAVIILLTLRQMVYDEMQSKQQRSVIPAAMEKKRKVDTPMTSTRLNRDTALLILSAH